MDFSLVTFVPMRPVPPPLLRSSLCFFKQKTAYDLRISDWSADVCSSDLQDYLIRLADAMEARENDFYTLLTREQGKPLDQARFEVGGAIEIGRASCSGKSVSVRVDLGGRRIIKKRHHLSEHL